MIWCQRGKKYQSMIGILQCAVSHGKFDIKMATMTMSRFCAAPKSVIWIVYKDVWISKEVLMCDSPS
jgi:hypothetical protein